MYSHLFALALSIAFGVGKVNQETLYLVFSACCTSQHIVYVTHGPVLALSGRDPILTCAEFPVFPNKKAHRPQPARFLHFIRCSPGLLQGCHSPSPPRVRRVSLPVQRHRDPAAADGQPSKPALLHRGKRRSSNDRSVPIPPERTGTADGKDSGDHQKYGSLRLAQGLPDPQPVTVREVGFSGTTAGSCRPAAAKGARIPGSWCFPADPHQDPFQWTEVRPRSPHRQTESRPRCPDRSSHGSITGIRFSICFLRGFGSSTLQRLSG